MNSKQHGYSLIEVLVAFAVLALALIILLGTLRNSGEQVRWAGDAGQAAIYARSVLDEATAAQVLTSGQQQGQSPDGHMHWTLEIRPWDDPDPQALQRAQQQASGNRMMHLQLDLRWGEGAREQMRVQSLRLARLQPEQGL